ncbi:peptidase inhibitor family I36 protein [Arcanobacterium haemolyticum]|nr:peptidase inhibitor family I36 protein [Arcanobacterium haemolyticum]
MMKSRKVLGSLMAVLALGGTSFVATIPAAEASDSSCPVGASCVWTGKGYTGIKGRNYDHSSPVHESINNQGKSAAANGATCKKTRFYDYTWGNSGSFFILHSESIVGTNYRDPDLSNGAGVGDYAHENWENRVSRITYVCD